MNGTLDRNAAAADLPAEASRAESSPPQFGCRYARALPHTAANAIHLRARYAATPATRSRDAVIITTHNFITDV